MQTDLAHLLSVSWSHNIIFNIYINLLFVQITSPIENIFTDLSHICHRDQFCHASGVITWLY
jgi:hypothetical protein